MPFCQLPMCMGMPCVSSVHRRVVEGRGVGNPGCVVFFFLLCVWRLSYVVDSCNVVTTEHGRYGLSCTYVETVECMSSAGCV